MTATDLSTVFYRVNDEGTADLLDVETGQSITRLDLPDARLNGIYPVGSQFGVRYEHPEGITLTLSDVARAGIQGDL